MPAARRLTAATAFALLAARAGAQSRDTATYATPALGALVGAAARDNRVPGTLAGYRASVESEMGLALRREDGVEALVGVEQIASTLQWKRTGDYEQHVVGYRSQQTVPTASMAALLRSGWIAPVLYGERLLPPRPPQLDSSRNARGARGARRRVFRPDTAFVVVHPLAADRARYYRYTGGDTVVTLRVPVPNGANGDTRAVPIVRVHVEPRADAPPKAGLFVGDVDLDAVRHVVVRLRGQYLALSQPRRGLEARLVRGAVQGYVFVEYETAERGERYWLPTYQRLEFQAVVPALGDGRAVFRIVSRVRDVELDTTTLIASDSASRNATRARPWWRLTRASGDTLRRFDAWHDPLGTASGALHADDFDDVAPDGWRATGPPRVEPYAARGSDFARFDRVEGLFTGAGVRVRFRDAAPGLVLRATGGWAWAERTARGRVELERELGVHRSREAGDRFVRDSLGVHGRWTLGARAARSLDLTNDFRNPLDSGNSAGAMLGGSDPYDYVDRRLATTFVRRTLGSRAAVMRLEVGAARDANAIAHVTRGLIASSTPFLPNRGVDAGGYVRTAFTLEVHPDVAAEFVRPGVGARLLYERGDGAGNHPLDFQRAELRVVSREELDVPWPGTLRGSTLTASGSGDVGALLGSGRPAQQLFELGGDMSLQGYDYKTFAGDRAGIVRGTLVYGSPWGRAPIRVMRFALPGFSPGFSVGAEAGWASASTDAARAAIARLGAPLVGADTPFPRPSHGTRATLDLGLRFFGGALFVGAARPIDAHDDRPRGWRRVFALGATM